jgi:hypothetical protein
MYLTVKSLFKRASLFIAFLVVGGGALIFFNTHTTSLHNALVTLDLIPKAENFTELYFNKNATLPGTTTANQAIRFTFVIHNLEITDMHYVYAVSVIAHGQRHVVDRENVLVKINHYYIKNEQLQLIKVSGRQEIIVELTNKHQSIDFWAEKY